MHETKRLAEFVTATRFEDLPPATVEKAKEAVRDYVGVALYGATHPVGDRIMEYVLASHPGEATTIGRESASAPGAALANGTFGHAIDYDDTFESLVIHPTSPIFPAALAGFEATQEDLPKAGGRDVLAGYVVGSEIAYRLGTAMFPSHYDAGWHATGTLGAFGAAGAAASTMDLDTDETIHAFGIVASLSSALKKNFGTMVKPLHAGHAASAGVQAATLADAGFTADDAIFEGDIGYGEVMTPGGEYDAGTLTDGLNSEWAVHDIGYKPYPSGVITHAAMDATLELARTESIEAADVERVVVTLDQAADEMLIRGGATDELEAKFSIEFCLAAVIRAAPTEVGVREFTDEYVTDEHTQRLMDRVERDFESGLFGEDFAGYGARVRVQTRDGERYENELRHAPGSPNNPLSEDRLRRKFDESASATLSEQRVETVRSAVESLDRDGALATLLDTVGDGSVKE